jgi:hypothetical protein
MLAREVLRLRGTLASREVEWDVVVDLYFYRDPEAEENKEGGDEAKAVGADEVGPGMVETGFVNNAEWGDAAAPAAPGVDGAAQPDANWDQGGADWAASGGADAGATTGGASGW